MDDARQLRAERQAAVRNAWKAEAERVRNGMGTRNWSKDEQAQILSRGSVKGYEGHHMVSVSSNRALAGDPKNIQFLNRDEHINGAHKGSTQNPTNGYYNPQTKTMEPFANNEPTAQPVYNLSNGQVMSAEEVSAQEAAAANAQGNGQTNTQAATQTATETSTQTATETSTETATEATTEDTGQTTTSEEGPAVGPTEGGGEDGGPTEDDGEDR